MPVIPIRENALIAVRKYVALKNAEEEGKPNGKILMLADITDEAIKEYFEKRNMTIGQFLPKEESQNENSNPPPVTENGSKQISESS